MKASVVVTLERVRQCVEHLLDQSVEPADIIVVDASRDDETARIVSGFPVVRYIHNPLGSGHRTESRNMGIDATTGDVPAFVDDDAYAQPDWLNNSLTSYEALAVAYVGGRAGVGVPDKKTAGAHEIGRLRPDGILTGNFAADPGTTVDVNHAIGCGMSFRADVLRSVDGSGHDYAGTALREGTDIRCAAAASGGASCSTPTPSSITWRPVRGRCRGSTCGDKYLRHRNHLVLVRYFRLMDARVRRYLMTTMRTLVYGCARSTVGGDARLVIALAGICKGLQEGAHLGRPELPSAWSCGTPSPCALKDRNGRRP